MSSAVGSQAALSAANFMIGLVLIRTAAAREYSYYLLAINGIQLFVSLQNAIFNPALACRVGSLKRIPRPVLVSSLYLEQQRLTLAIGVSGIAAVAAGWATGLLEPATAAVAGAATLALTAVLHREFLRMALFSSHRPHAVLRGDLLFVALLLAGVLAGTQTPAAATAVMAATALAAIASGALLYRFARRQGPWQAHASLPILRQVAPLLAWSTAGAGIHWAFSQGYIYLVAGTLGVSAVATLGATRLLVMPIVLLSSGVGSLMLPLAAKWLEDHGPRLLLKRLAMLAGAMCAAGLCYFAVLWIFRDWVFGTVLHKHVLERDTIILLWGLTSVAMVIRDQLSFLLVAQGRFRDLTVFTAFTAVVSLAASYVGIRQFGVTGALAGVLTGEVVSGLGVGLMSWRTAARFVEPG